MRQGRFRCLVPFSVTHLRSGRPPSRPSAGWDAGRYEGDETRLPKTALVALLTVAIPCVVVAGPATKPSDAPATLAQRAGDAAVQELIDQVMHLRLATGQAVSTLLAPSAAGERALWEMILARHQASRAHHLADGGVEVDAWLPAAAVIASLREIAAAQLPRVDRNSLALSPAAGPIIVATGRYHDDGRPRDRHPGWRHCDARQVALAESAAEIDLRAALFDRLARLRLSRLRTVGDLMRRHPRFADAVRRRIHNVASAEPVLEPVGLCRRTAAISRADVITLLARAATESAEPIDVDFSRLTDPAFEDPLAASGFAVAPSPGALSGMAAWATESPRPAWADQLLTAQSTGQAPADVGDEQTRRELAARAARIEATRRLWMKIEALPLPQGGTIATLLADDPDAVQAFAAVDDAVFPTGTPVFGEDGTATVSAAVQLRNVWRIARDLRQTTTRPTPSTEPR